MKSGAYFSSIFVIWIVATIAAFFMLYPEIVKSLNSLESVKQANPNIAQLIDPASTDEPIDPINYTPLSVFNKLGL